MRLVHGNYQRLREWQPNSWMRVDSCRPVQEQGQCLAVCVFVSTESKDMKFLVADRTQPFFHGAWIQVAKDSATGWASTLISALGLPRWQPFLGSHMEVATGAGDKTQLVRVVVVPVPSVEATGGKLPSDDGWWCELRDVSCALVHRVVACAAALIEQRTPRGKHRVPLEARIVGAHGAGVIMRTPVHRKPMVKHPKADDFQSRLVIMEMHQQILQKQLRQIPTEDPQAEYLHGVADSIKPLDVELMPEALRHRVFDFDNEELRTRPLRPAPKVPVTD